MNAVELQEREERRRALRTLLARPLVLPESPAFPLVRRHAAWLADWLGRYPRWAFQVTPELARVRKTAGDPTDGTRPARDPKSDTRERELLENHLVDDIAALLHARIHDAVQLVREMSAQVESRKTSTGMRLRFTWELRDDADPTEVEARKRLLRAGATWGPQDRALLGAFLKGRLDDARARDPGGTWTKPLRGGGCRVECSAARVT